MNIELLVVGKTDSKEVEALVELYARRVNRYCRFAVTALPADLNAAIERMEEDPLVRNVLGSHIYEKYLAAKRTEWREYRMRVSQWELDEYLGKY